MKDSRKYFKYIDDSKFINLVTWLIDEYEKIVENNDIFKNRIDPFHFATQLFSNGATLEEQKSFQRKINAGKSLSNKIGDFHERAMSMLDGFEPFDGLLPEGVTNPDVQSSDVKMAIEIKNKFNTVKGSNMDVIFKTLKECLEIGYEKGIYLIVNAKETVNENLRVSKHKKIYEDDNVFKMSIDAFLNEVFNDEKAFSGYVDAFLRCFNDVMKIRDSKEISQEILDELRKEVFDENYKKYEFYE